MTRFILVRHGQTIWNQQERFRGLSDVPLDEVGLAQAEATGRRLAKDVQPAAVYSSVVWRARQTAEAIARPHGLAVQLLPGIADIDFGLLQGLTVQEATVRWPAVVESWMISPHHTRFPEGERLGALRERAASTLAQLGARHPNDAIILVGHTVINRVILLYVMGLGNERFWRLSQSTCAINVFDSQDGEFTMVSLNDTCHLNGLA
jgi:broad specificity phosphatase PhoE